MSMKSKISTMVVFLAIPLALAACKTTEEALMESGKQALDAAAITTLHSGNTVTWKTARASGTANYNTNSTAKLNWGQGDKAGTWRVDADANHLCTKWEYNGNMEKCYSVYKTAENVYQTIDASGNLSSTYSVK